MSGLESTHPDEKHLLPDTITSLRLSLHAELVRTPAGGVICDVAHLCNRKCFRDVPTPMLNLNAHAGVARRRKRTASSSSFPVLFLLGVTLAGGGEGAGEAEGDGGRGWTGDTGDGGG